MREIQASEAKAKFSALLDAVERGETIAITRHGEVVARLEPGREKHTEKVADTFARMDALRKQVEGKVTFEEILEWRREGLQD